MHKRPIVACINREDAVSWFYGPAYQLRDMILISRFFRSNQGSIKCVFVPLRLSTRQREMLLHHQPPTSDILVMRSAFVPHSKLPDDVTLRRDGKAPSECYSTAAIL